MKRTFLKLALPLISGIIIISMLSAFMGYYPGGSPGGYSGSPLDVKNCTYCHTGTAVTHAGIISSDIDSSGYNPGSLYNITVTVPGSGLKGFEVSALSTSELNAGKFIAGSNTRLVNSSKAVTHSVTNGSDPSVWSFSWTAPSKGTGSITFYGAFAATKSKTMLSTLTVKEKQPASIASDEEAQLIIKYESSGNRLIFESAIQNQQLFSAKIYSVEGREVKQIPAKILHCGINTWETDLGGLKIHGIYIIKYSIGTKTSARSIYLY